MVKVEIMDINLTAEAKEVEEAVRSCLHEEPSSQVKVSNDEEVLERYNGGLH